MSTEESLSGVSPRGPSPLLRRRVLDAARAEIADRDSLLERAWRSCLFWSASAVAVCVSVVLVFLVEPYVPSAAPRTSPSVEQASCTAPEGFGGDETTHLRSALARAAAAPVPCNVTDDNMSEDLL